MEKKILLMRQQNSIPISKQKKKKIQIPIIMITFKCLLAKYQTLLLIKLYSTEIQNKVTKHN